jgi:hypothetical protein
VRSVEEQPAGGRAPATTEVTLRRFRPASRGAAAFRLDSPLIALLAFGLVLVLFAACAALLYLSRDYRHAIYGGGGAVAGLVAAAVGMVVARREPRNPIGWLLVGWAVLIPVVGVVQLYSVLDFRIHHGAWPLGRAAVLLEAAEFLIAVVSGLAVLLFPDGRLPSRRWRWVLWPYLGCCAMFMAHQFIDQAVAIGVQPLRVGLTGVPLSNPNPAGVAALVAHLGQAGGWLILGFWLVFVGRQVASYRRSASQRRQQLKWLIGGAVSCVIATAVTIVTGNDSSVIAQVIQDTADLGAAALPVGIGVGIVKYRLYDIDRIISRTLAYAIVTGLLAGVYAGLVLLASQVLLATSPVAVAGSTLVVAALFHPLRRRVQRVVDRRFNRARYDADRMVAAFAARLQDALDLDSVRDDLASVVYKTLEPAHVSVWIRERG